ncbi:hypothetical protein Tsubulata_034894, partial [Turnera subulata]
MPTLVVQIPQIRTVVQPQTKQLTAPNPIKVETHPVTPANLFPTVQNDLLSPQSSVGNVQGAPLASSPSNSRDNDISVIGDERHFIGNIKIHLLCIEHLNIVDRWRWQETFKAKWSDAHSSEGSTGEEMSRANGPREVSVWLEAVGGMKKGRAYGLAGQARCFFLDSSSSAPGNDANMSEDNDDDSSASKTGEEEGGSTSE